MVASITNKHPEYTHALPDWTQMRDAYVGERQVKSKSGDYLPPTTSHILDGYGSADRKAVGALAYHAYKTRARFPGFVREAVQMAIGMMHSQPPEIILPAAMQGIRSKKGEDLPQLLRRINTEQLITGRIGLMADLPTVSGQSDTPYLTTYAAEKIINWEDGEAHANIPSTLNMVVLDESENVRGTSFEWTMKTKHRVLLLGSLEANEQTALYRQGLFDEMNPFSFGMMKSPSRLGTTLSQIPFVIINSCDVVCDVDDPPLMDLSNLCMTIYRGDADYRHNLYMQGQDTFVTTGANIEEDDQIRVGANARLDLPMGATAEYVGVGATGLSEQRVSLEKMEARAGSMGAQTMDTTSRERESGDSLRIRVAARTADMNQIVEAGATGLENILKICAVWMGENPDEVSVKGNKEFGEMPLTGQSMVEMSAARNQGFPISAKSMHNLALKRRVTAMTFEEEIAQMKLEADDPVLAPKEKADLSPDQPNANGNGPEGQTAGSGNGPDA